MDSPEDKERLTLHLRILDILEPIDHRTVQDSMVEPRAGELLLKKKEHIDFTPWSYSPKIGGKNHKALVEFLLNIERPIKPSLMFEQNV